jgi:predicted  nucleic acid-binding Zn-ribbon protein
MAEGTDETGNAANATNAPATPAPADPYITKLEAAESDLRSVQDDVALASIYDAVSDLDTQIRDLPGAIQQVRTRGYVFKKYLENKAEVLTAQWADMRWRVTAAVEENSRQLRADADRVQSRMVSLRTYRNENEVGDIQSAIDTLESRVSAAQSAIGNMYSPVRDNVNQTLNQLKDATWALDQVDSACFKLYPGEGVVAAVKGQWMTSEKEGPKGIFFLTEDRVLFEQREEIVTKKVLFIATAKQKVQELKWQAAMGQIVQVNASEQGGGFLGIGKKELLGLAFDNRVPIRNVTVRLEADSDAWQASIGRVKSGDIAAERAVPRDQAAAAEVKAAPTKCTTCGAAMGQSVVRGMQEIKCEYCGAVTRL